MVDVASVRFLPAALAAELVEHYHSERNHQGLDKELIPGALTVEDNLGRIRRRQRPFSPERDEHFLF